MFDKLHLFPFSTEKTCFQQSNRILEPKHKLSLLQATPIILESGGQNVEKLIFQKCIQGATAKTFDLMSTHFPFNFVFVH